jgi:hypothetical protein
MTINNDRIIPVDSEPPSPTFRTAGEAIRYTHPLLPKAKADTLRLQGAVIDDGYWTDEELVMRFSNGLFLHVFVEDEDEGWEVLNQEPVLLASSPERIGSPPVSLRWGSGREVSWDRSSLLKHRLGGKCEKLWYSVGLLVFVRGHPPLWFKSIYRTDTGRRVLYVGVSE